MNRPLVSIIIPIYNVEAYLERCLISIIRQTYTNIEILAINDGSTDRSDQILHAFQKKDQRIRIIEKTNGGQASARNLGLDLANGEYLLMVDSDDYIDADTVNQCLMTMVQNQYDLIIFDFYQMKANGHKKRIYNGTGLHDAGTVPWNKFYKKILWEDLRFPEGYWYEDLGIVPAVVARAKKIGKLDESLYYYETGRKESQTNLLATEKLFDIISMVENVYEEMKKNKLHVKNKDLEVLFFRHLFYATLLLKVPYIENHVARKKLIMKVSATMNAYFPNWKYPSFVDGNFITNLLIKLSISCYLHHFILLGNLFWKYPKKIKNTLLEISNSRVNAD
ncbi:glycosyltransferase family 2 protein [Sporolactobacillus shoreicorticis]|uniref:Glycosyltransferase family 2 protein n=1 Tax=Sporolactobacillus shoreicorticis TaxID=1923877 RepID=A0ABW5S5D4_9BACL|nr:glycosyltransferase family A protein [Sporolactobacillus shoreicorticis]MCO7124212.1 glycosyltransferase family 2 protein [Sporolactobacillus shoreicorticis]